MNDNDIIHYGEASYISLADHFKLISKYLLYYKYRHCIFNVLTNGCKPLFLSNMSHSMGEEEYDRHLMVFLL